MAGHSHWANIAHKKGRVDKKKGALFGKLSRAIIVSARRGGGDPSMNLALRYAIDKARKNSMPKDNIERAIKKGCGTNDNENYEDVVYEGYGPGGVAVMVEALTENRNRTAGEVRKTFEVYGGNLGATGCVSYMFERKGIFVLSADSISEERLFEIALEAGADEVRQEGENFEVLCPPDMFQTVSDALEQIGIETSRSELTRIPGSTIDLDADSGRKLLKLLDVFEENEDVQNVIANFNISDEIMEEVLGEA
jgi:YebC/PmpR family DNA-binding regulatory protein